MRYLFLYCYKGHDRASVAVAGRTKLEPNEIKAFQDARYVSGCESLWRIFQFVMHGRHPAVCRLPVHLEDQQRVIFVDGVPVQQAIDDAADKHTQLTGWFVLCEEDEHARQFTYVQLPLHYIWDKGNRRWKRRDPKKNKAKVIVRLHTVPIKNRELLALRLLLHHAIGKTSWKDLMTVDGDMCDTWQDVINTMGLAPGDDRWSLILEEAAVYCKPHQLRRLFAQILAHCSPSDPNKLWEDFRVYLSDDFVHRMKKANGRQINDDELEVAWNKALASIDNILRGLGMSLLSNFAASMPQPPTHMLLDCNNEDDESGAAPTECAVNEQIQSLNEDQQVAFNKIIAAVKRHHCISPTDLPQYGEERAFGNSNDSSNFHRGDGGSSSGLFSNTMNDITHRNSFNSDNCLPHLFFIDGPGGTGKSFLYNALIDKVMFEHAHKPITVSSCGIAALVLKGGRTAHSTFKIPMPVHEGDFCGFKKQEPIATSIRDAPVIFWDEAPVMNRLAFEAVSRSCQDVMGNSRPFGGKVVVFGGDFRQTLPVVKGKGASPERVVKYSLRYASFWDQVCRLPLTRNMRVKAHSRYKWFVDFITNVGNGTTPVLPQKDLIRIPDALVFNPLQDADQVEKQFIRACYPNIDNGTTIPNFVDTVILTVRNTQADCLNNYAVDMYCPDQEATVYTAVDSIANDDDRAASRVINERDLKDFVPPDFPPYELRLKSGMPIICIRNIDATNGLCNGTRLIVKETHTHTIIATFATGERSGQNVTLCPIPHTTFEDGSTPLPITRLQFPIKPAFAMTINKSQGQTLNHVGVFLSQSAFSHGQLYVALSRCTSPDNLKVYVADGSIKGLEGSYTRNVVYTQVLKW